MLPLVMQYVLEGLSVEPTCWNSGPPGTLAHLVSTTFEGALGHATSVSTFWNRKTQRRVTVYVSVRL